MKKMKRNIIIVFVSGALLGLSACCDCPTKETSLLDIGDRALGLLEDSVHTPDPIHQMLRHNKSTIHYGIDISHYQGDLMAEISPRDSLRFVICKATQGDHYVDPEFSSNWHAIRSKGFIRGAYHFYSNKYPPKTQAAHFASTIKGIDHNDIPPILDIEAGSLSEPMPTKKLEADLFTFLETVQQITGRRPMVYTNTAFAQQYLQNTDFAKYELWLAEYTSAKEPKIPSTWKANGYKIWQKSESYSAYTRMLDFDVYNGSLSELVQ